MTRIDPEEIVARVSKDLKLEDDILVLGSQLRNRKTKRTSTGILALDVALGGGLPLNQWSEIVGHESSGKTALALKVVAHQQAMDPDWFGVWVAAEGLEEEYAESLGVDLDRILVVDSNAMEEVYDVLTKLLNTQSFDGIVIDSLPALVPTGEYDEASFENQHMALAARLNGKFFRKATRAGKRSLVHEERPWLGIIINQWRERVGFVMGDPRTTPGGKAKNYSFYVRLETKRDEFIDNDLKRSDPAYERVGQKIVCKILKNKSGPPERSASFDFYFAPHNGFGLGDIDRVTDVFNTSTMLNVVTREGNSYFFLGERIGANRPRALEALEDDPELVARIEREVLDHLERRTSGDVVQADPVVAEPRRRVVKRG